MKEEPELFLIDSNILVYAYDKTDVQKHRIAQELLNKCWRREVTYVISAQNLAEFFIIVTKKVPRPLSVDEAEQIVNDIIHFSHWKVLHYDAQVLQKAMTLYKQTKKHFWDAVLLATMLSEGVFSLYTENVKDFAGYAHLTIKNPFL